MDSEMNIYTVNDYLINKVKFEMPMKTLLGIMHDRELENGIDIEACDKAEAEAEWEKAHGGDSSPSKEDDKKSSTIEKAPPKE